MPTLINKGAMLYPDLPDEIPIDYIYNLVKTKLTQPLASNPFQSRLLILEAKTASGKSVTIPPVMAALLADVGGIYSSKKVICTQPRVLTAMSIPREIDGVSWFKKYNGHVFKLDDNMAYHTGPFQSNMSSSVKLIYSSNGVLDAQLTKQSAEYILKRYGCIIIDEAHERNMVFDRTLMMLKHLFINNSTNPELPFIICMSATFDYNRYAKFFNCDENNIVRVAGQSFDIDDRWPTSDVAAYVPETVKKVRECIDEELAKDIAKCAPKPTISPPEIDSNNRILVFFPGSAETRKLIKGLKKLDPENSTLVKSSTLDDIETITYIYVFSTAGHENKKIELTIEILPFDSQAVARSSKAYLKVSGSDEGRKQQIHLRFSIQVLITGAVAETGLSLPDLQYVIDAGWNKSSEFNPRVNIRRVLIVAPGAQSQLTQRRGRVGRMKPGVRIPLYTKATFDSLPVLQEPDIIRDDPTMMLLVYAAIYGDLEVGDGGKSGIPMSERLLDSPSSAASEFAVRKLQMLGFLDNIGKITDSGRIAAKITSLDVQQVGMILAGLVWDVSLDDLVAIAVMTPELNGSDSVWGYNPIEKMELEKATSNKSNKRAMFEAREKLRVRTPTVEQWNEVLSVVFPNESNKQNLYYKYRLICCDQFLDGLFVYRAFQTKFGQCMLRAAAERKDNAWVVTEMHLWSSKAFIKYSKFVKLVEMYTKTLDDLVTSGINVYKNKNSSIARLPLSAGPPFMDALIRIKKCIQFGYKANTATLRPDGKYDVWCSKLDEKIELRKKNPRANLPDGDKLQITWSLFDDPVADWKNMQAAYEYIPKTIIFRMLDVFKYDPETRGYPVRVVDVSVVSGF